MLCPNCNQSLPDDSGFCMYCGTKIESSPPPVRAEKSSRSALVRWIINAALLAAVIALAVLNISQYHQSQQQQAIFLSLQEKNAELDQTISEISTSNDAYRQSADEKEEEYREITEKLDIYKKEGFLFSCPYTFNVSVLHNNWDCSKVLEGYPFVVTGLPFISSGLGPFYIHCPDCYPS